MRLFYFRSAITILLAASVQLGYGQTRAEALIAWGDSLLVELDEVEAELQRVCEGTTYGDVQAGRITRYVRAEGLIGTMQGHLNAFSRAIDSYRTDSPPLGLIAPDGADHPRYRTHWQLRDRSYRQLYFEEKDLETCLATLAELRRAVARRQAALRPHTTDPLGIQSINEVWYQGAANAIDIRLPGEVDADELRLQLDGEGLVFADTADSTRVWVVPYQSGVSLRVMLAQVEAHAGYPVVPIPTPDVSFHHGQVPLRTYRARGLTIGSMNQIRVELTAEAGFAEACPQDARYRVRRWQAWLTLANQEVPHSRVEFSNPRGNIRPLKLLAEPGMRLVVWVQEVERQTYTGEWQRIDMPPASYDVGLVE